MDSYLDISIRKDPDFSANHLMSVLFKKLHRALVKVDSRGIGVSFPEYGKRSVGGVLRLHGSSAALKRIMQLNWLTGMHDHVDLTKIKSVPTACKHRTVQRVQAKSSAERLRRRAMRRHGINAKQAREKIPDSAAETLTLPFIQLTSESSGQHFRLFIKHGKLQDKPVEGPFTSYGFSGQSTIPWFQ